MKTENKCSTPYCRNERAKDRTICDKCRMREYKKRHPIEYTYNAFRTNAKRRGKEFKVTLEEFKQFCRETNYLELKGKYKYDYSIHREINEKGYLLENMGIKTVSENVKIQREEEKRCPF